MKIKVSPSKLSGEIIIPGSKSHTIRALALAAFSEGKSVLTNVLHSDDTRSCVEAIKVLGAKVSENGSKLEIEGIGKFVNKDCFIDVGNSGTTLRILTGLAALGDKKITFDGDESIRRRPMKPLFDALSNLGVKIDSNNGKCPFTIQGPVLGGRTSVDGISSQFLTSLLLMAPLANDPIEINVDNLHEKPYVEMTQAWLNKMGIQYQSEGLDHYIFRGGDAYKSFNAEIPADFSSATFSVCAAAITQSEILIKGLDFDDFQGDKQVFTYLKDMGLSLSYQKEGVLVKGGLLSGIDIDMNATPDALPAVSVVGTFASGITRLQNVRQARLKECDRIAAMYTELSKMGAVVEQQEDGITLKNGSLKGVEVHGYHDHRMVMSLCLAAFIASGDTIIDTAEAIGVTYPSFIHDFKKLGANIEVLD